MIKVKSLITLKSGLSVQNLIVELINKQTIYIRKNQKDYVVEFVIGYFLSKEAYLNGIDPLQIENISLTLNEIEAQDVFNQAYSRVCSKFTDFEILPNVPDVVPQSVNP